MSFSLALSVVFLFLEQIALWIVDFRRFLFRTWGWNYRTGCAFSMTSYAKAKQFECNELSNYIQNCSLKHDKFFPFVYQRILPCYCHKLAHLFFEPQSRCGFLQTFSPSKKQRKRNETKKQLHLLTHLHFLRFTIQNVTKGEHWTILEWMTTYVLSCNWN